MMVRVAAGFLLVLCCAACVAAQASQDRFAEAQAQDEATVVIEAGVTNRAERASAAVSSVPPRAAPSAGPALPVTAQGLDVKADTSLSVGGQTVQGLTPPEKVPDSLATLEDIQNMVHSPLQKQLLIQEMRRQDADIQREIADTQRESVAVAKAAEEKKMKEFTAKERQERLKKYDVALAERNSKQQYRRRVRTERINKRRRKVEKKEELHKSRELARKRRRRQRRMRSHKLELRRKSYRAAEFRQKTLERTTKAAAATRGYQLKLSKEQFSKKQGIENEKKRRKFQWQLLKEQDRKAERYSKKFMRSQMNEKQRKQAPLKEETRKVEAQAAADVAYEKRLAVEEKQKHKIMKEIEDKAELERQKKHQRRVAFQKHLAEMGVKEAAHKDDSPRGRALRQAAAEAEGEATKENQNKAALIAQLHNKGEQEKVAKQQVVLALQKKAEQDKVARAEAAANKAEAFRNAMQDTNPVTELKLPHPQGNGEAQLVSHLKATQQHLLKVDQERSKEAKKFDAVADEKAREAAIHAVKLANEDLKRRLAQENASS